MATFLDRYKRPEYTGENRCPPCTAVNVVLAFLLAGAAGLAFLPLSVPVLAVALLTIYLRGYLVPKTPELTKRYFPDWLLARFDKADDPASAGPDPVTAARADADAEGIVDPETLLTAAGVVEECEIEDDLCLTDSFTEAWLATVERVRHDETRRREAVAALFDRETVTLESDSHGRRHAFDDDEHLYAWVSEGAFVADLAAAEIVAKRADWDEVLPEQRAAILKALRSFFDVCPLCEGEVTMTEDSVESCCRSFDVIAVRCRDCGEHFLEVNPETMQETVSGRASVTSDDENGSDDARTTN